MPDQRKTIDDYRTDLITIRERLRPAVWSPSWNAAQPLVDQAWHALVALGMELALRSDIANTCPVAMATGRALGHVQSALNAAAAATQANRNPTTATRGPVSQALAALDELGSR